MSWTAAAIVGGSVLGGMISADAAGDAADTQAGAANRSADLQMQQFQQTRADLYPWMSSGSASLNNLNYLLGNTNQAPSDSTVAGSIGMGRGDALRQFTLADFQESPAYQFNLQQGQKAIENAASKNKTLYAPQTLQDIGRFSQGLASNEFQNAMGNFYGFQDRLFNRLYSLSGSGQNAAAQTGAFGTNAAGQAGDALMSGAAASAAGRVGSANAINNSIGQGINGMFMNQILANNQRSSVPMSSLPEMTGANDLFGNYG